ncbi:glycerol-3-phosphate dehydrogenase/oxidase [Kaarinaea lacus]
MDDLHYDVVVVGGGIHGAGIAQAAAANGYSVLLLEKTAIGAATSSKSSKLIHGGLRYLESFQFGLVRECLQERSILLRNAPELVTLVPFYIPVYQHTVRRPWKIHVGLQLYRMLSGFDQDARFSKLSPRQWDALDGLHLESLQAVYQYFDAQTDDVALTKAVVQSAQSLGAEVLCPASFDNASIHEQGCDISISSAGQQFSYTCSVLINATGAWVNQVLEKCIPHQTGITIDHVQGTHIIVNDRAKSGVFYLEAPQDQRAIFVIPWKGLTMIGTTETVFRGDVANVVPLDDEIDYLLNTYNHYFSDQAKRREDVTDAFAGLRVLPQSSDSPFSRVRDTRLLSNVDDRPRLVTMYGGKLTAYRSTAERVIQLIRGSLPQRKSRGDTRTLNLSPVE